MAKSGTPRKAAKAAKVAAGYTHPDQTVALRPQVGTQAQFRTKKSPVTYRYDKVVQRCVLSCWS